MSVRIERNEDGSIRVEGRWDTMASVQAEALMKEVIPDHEAVIMDCGALTYISSAGLRSLMMLYQRSESLTLVDVSPEVYEILDMTGLHRIITVEKKMREVSMDGMTMLGKGASSEVYRMDDEHVLKLYLSGIALELIRQERSYAQTAFLHGVKTAVVYDTVRCGDRYGTIFELVDAHTLSSKIADAPERLEEYTRKEAELLYEIHHTHFQEGALPKLSEHYHQKVDRLGDYLTTEEMESLHTLIGSIPERDTLVHGDFHPKNIVVSDGKLMLIDMAEASVGHPLLDLAASYIPFVRIPQTAPDLCEEILGLSPETMRSSWDILLDAYFERAGMEYRRRAEQLCEKLFWLKRLLILPDLTMYPQMQEGFARAAREEFFPVIGTLTEQYRDLLENI